MKEKRLKDYAPIPTLDIFLHVAVGAMFAVSAAFIAFFFSLYRPAARIDVGSLLRLLLLSSILGSLVALTVANFWRRNVRGYSILWWREPGTDTECYQIWEQEYKTLPPTTLGFWMPLGGRLDRHYAPPSLFGPVAQKLMKQRGGWTVRIAHVAADDTIRVRTTDSLGDSLETNEKEAVEFLICAAENEWVSFRHARAWAAMTAALLTETQAALEGTKKDREATCKIRDAAFDVIAEAIRKLHATRRAIRTKDVMGIRGRIIGEFRKLLPLGDPRLIEFARPQGRPDTKKETDGYDAG